MLNTNPFNDQEEYTLTWNFASVPILKFPRITVIMEVIFKTLSVHPTTLQGYQFQNMRVMKEFCSMGECREGKATHYTVPPTTYEGFPSYGCLEIKVADVHIPTEISQDIETRFVAD